MKLSEFLADCHPAEEFQSGMIVEEQILKILDAGRWAPSAENEQSWRFIIVQNEDQRLGIVEAVKTQDPRIFKNQTTQPINLTQKELNKFVVEFAEANYDGKNDPYRDIISSAHAADVTCMESAGCLIICTFQSGIVSKMFGELDMGAAVLNILLSIHALGLAFRLIRNFDREQVAKSCQIPNNIIITAIIAVGNHKESKNNLHPKDPLNDQTKKEQLVDMILDRRSIRQFRKDPLPAEFMANLKRIPEYLSLFNAHSSSPPFYELVGETDQTFITKIASFAKIVFVKQMHVPRSAGMLVMKFQPLGAAGFIGYGRLDLGMIIQACLLEAYSQGIGTCWIGAYNHGLARQVMGLTNLWRVDSIIAFGYPAEYAGNPKRKPLGNIIFKNQWNNSFQQPKDLNIWQGDNDSLLRKNPAGQPTIFPFKEEWEKK